jgi:hypothetical protein
VQILAAKEFDHADVIAGIIAFFICSLGVMLISIKRCVRVAMPIEGVVYNCSPSGVYQFGCPQ